MTDEEREIALYCLKASSDYHSEVCDECVKHPNCDHMIQDDVTETIIKALEQQPKTGHWIDIMVGDMPAQACDQCNTFYPLAYTGGGHNYCPNCGAKMEEVEE